MYLVEVTDAHVVTYYVPYSRRRAAVPVASAVLVTEKHPPAPLWYGLGATETDMF